jgi:subtilisin family serine protease
VATLFATALPVVGAADDAPDLAANGRSVVEGDYDSYIVVMQADPLVVTEGKDNLDSKKAKTRGKAMKASHGKALKDAGVEADITNSYVNALNGFSATLTFAEAQKVAGQDGVAMVIPDELLQATTDSSPTFLGLDGPAGAWQTGYDGEGVIVGVIDSGIWPEHPSFADDGSFPTAPPLDDSRPKCEFGNTTHNANDAAFECNNKLIGARQMIDTYRTLIGATPDEYDSARDDDGHGTHTASTAAGNADVEASMYGQPLGTISGIAPRAQIIAYKGLGALGGFTSDLAASIDQAVADGVDVINYSVGGGAAEPGGDEIAFLFADAAGVFVATSAGNSGPGAATLGNPGTMPWMTTVGASTQPRFYQGTVHLGDGSSYSGASITPAVGSATLVDGEDVGGDLCVPGTLDSAAVTGNIVLCRRGAIARAAKSLAVSQAGGVGMVMYENIDDNSLFTDSHWVPSVHIDNTPGLAVKAYIDSAGADATASITTGEVTEWPSAPSMTYFSSRGPNPVSPDIIKPDITAPGIQILAGNTPTPIGGLQGELFQAIAGTSMSSPHVAGLFALIKQAHPDWSPAMARSGLMTTAYQDVVDNDRVSPADPFDFGAGHANPGKAVHKGSAFQPGLAYDAGLFEYAAYTCGEDFGVFTSGSCDFLDAIGVPSDPSDLNYPSIGVAEVAGSQTVVRTVTSVAQEVGWRTYNVSVDAPAGYEVTVSPSSFKIKKGQTATYEVTITNVSAPAGEWRFGSLTWTDQTGAYDVYSPIAVKGALFDAPADVFGTGTSGSANFDVSFGYNGTYSAAPHGLIADAPTTGSIGQDPDQTYPSADDSPVGVQKITYPISGSALVRWEMSIPGPDDIDLFLEDSSGNIIAASTNGGTDEFIELVLPADDTYTMVVHGWSIPNAPLPYELSYWNVPLASGGSLVIDSAPAAATPGTHTIDVSWSGLSAGTTYLGAVSHTGDSGLMGFTLVNVNTN